MRNKILAVGLVLSLAAIGMFATADICTNPKLGNCQAGGFGAESAVSAGVNARWDNLTEGWKLNEESDGSAPVTRVGVLGAYDMTDNNTVPSAAGILGNGILPASVNLEYLSNNAVSGITGAITVSCWVKRVGSIGGAKAVISHYSGANSASSWAIFNSGATNIYFLIVDGTTQTVAGSSMTLALNTWHMLTFRKPAGESVATLDLDDISSTVSTASRPQINAATRKFIIGASDLPSLYLNNVVVDSVYYFVDELKDDAWVTGMWNSGAGRSYPN